MEVRKERSDVVVLLRANCQACGSVDDGPQTVQVATWQAGESDVAVVRRRTILPCGPDHDVCCFNC